MRPASKRGSLAFNVCPSILVIEDTLTKMTCYIPTVGFKTPAVFGASMSATAFTLVTPPAHLCEMDMNAVACLNLAHHAFNWFDLCTIQKFWYGKTPAAGFQLCG